MAQEQACNLLWKICGNDVTSTLANQGEARTFSYQPDISATFWAALQLFLPRRI
jgi:hypothetical protein